MTDQLTLVEFLTARLADDEAAARAAGGDAWRFDDTDYWRVTDSTGEVVAYDEGKPTEDQADHIARHDPARVLREVAAKRAIVKDHLEDHDPEHDCATNMRSLRPEHSGCYVIARLATVYLGCPDEWRPE